MFKFLRNLFISKKEPEVEEVKWDKLKEWFEERVSKIGFNEEAKSYFARIKEIKEQLPELINNLNNAEVSKDNKNVEERVKNIVIGHRDNFSRGIERFLEDLDFIRKESELSKEPKPFKTVSDYQEVADYNYKLDKKIEELAKRTAKSYQAAQHLFFDPVEKLFKKTGELNTLVKEFEKTIKHFHLERLIGVKELIKELSDEIIKSKDFAKKIKEKEILEKEIKDLLIKAKEEQEKLKKSEEYKNHLTVEKDIEDVEKKIKDNDNNVFTYFSKLAKPLRKYERIAIDNKIIQSYIDNGIKAFWQDSELKIRESLQGLKKALQEDKIPFENKQKNNFLELIKKSEKGYLEELKETGKELKLDKEELLKKVEGVEIIFKIDEVNQKINSENEKLNSLQKDISELKSKLEKIDLDKAKQEIVENINKIFKIKLKITSFSSF